MAQPYVGELRMFAGNFAPNGWMFCEGQQLPISENETLFQLIGTTYGGDGESTFNLPDLRGRLPMHFSNVIPLAQQAGAEEVTLTTNQIPVHTHQAVGATGFAQASTPTNGLLARSSAADPYQTDTSDGLQPMAAASLGPTGGSQPHTNFQPYLCINFIISLFGIFPSPT